MKIEHLGKSFYCDKRLFEDLKIYVNDVVKFDMDLPLVITGEESNGKSKLSRQISWVISYILKKYHNIDIIPDFNNIYFDLDKYIKDSINGQRYRINILDESRSLLNRKSSMTKESKRFTNFMSECRKFNQFHILCLPAMHDLDKYVFLWRMRYFINVLRSRDEKGDVVRGTYIVYPKDNRLIHCYESNFYQYPKFNPKVGGFKGSFPNFEPYDKMKEYEESQKEIMRKKYINNDKNPNQYEKKYLILVNDLNKNFGATETSRLVGVTPRRIYDIIKNFEERVNI